MCVSNVLESGKAVFVGIDVHKNSYSVCVILDGSPIKKARMPADPRGLVAWLRRNFSKWKICSAYEAGFAGFSLHRVLVAAGIDNRVVNAASIPIAANDRVKTDRRDATKIAWELSKGSISGIYVPTIKEELSRLLPRTREQLVIQRTRLGNQIKSKLLEFGLIDAGDDRHISFKLIEEYLAMDLPPELQFTIEILAELFKKVHSSIREIEAKMEKQASVKPQIEAIYRSIPGVGAISSRILATEIGDMTRFANERALFSYTGLTPREYSSGEKERRGGITRQGNTRVRHCLVEVAWRAIQQDPQLRARYDKLKHRCGGKRAIVAIARRLIGHMRACLRDQTPYKLTAA